jgi:UDP-4-amino-4-deoxy-L-arabinose-oxoglutarate aminotransferase
MLSQLCEMGIGTAVNYRAIHLLTYLAEMLGVPRGALPVAEEIGDRTISLPMYPTLTADDQDRVVDAVSTAWQALASRRGSYHCAEF